jgi:hypothetical protein
MYQLFHKVFIESKSISTSRYLFMMHPYDNRDLPKYFCIFIYLNETFYSILYTRSQTKAAREFSTRG